MITKVDILPQHVCVGCVEKMTAEGKSVVQACNLAPLEANCAEHNTGGGLLL